MAYTTIDDPSVYFQTALYTGDDSSALNVTNSGNSDLQPDWIWIKNRSDSCNHIIQDTSRGINVCFFPDDPAVEQTNSVFGHVNSVASDGFQVDRGNSGELNANSNSKNYVAWQWKCNGGTTETAVDESGSNPANVRQTNTDAGFSIITYTGTGSAGTIAHGLGVIPDWVIIKGRDTATDGMVYHGANTSAPETDALTLPENSATSDSADWWNDTAPTSSVFTLGTHDRVNTDGKLFIAYCFAEKQGYSKFGSYTGNANADGTFVYTGFKPAWLMVKMTDSTNVWQIYDNKREPNNPNIKRLNAEVQTAESTSGSDRLDFLSNGFKMRATSGNVNSANDYVYMAFAESPFVSSKGVPTTAR